MGRGSLCLKRGTWIGREAPLGFLQVWLGPLLLGRKPWVSRMGSERHVF